MFNVDRYVAALRFAAERHAGQLVPSSELPYLVHVTTVTAEVIAALPVTPGIDGDLAVQCALLHDTIEDTKTTYEEISAGFGTDVADGVRALSKDPTVDKPLQMHDSLQRIRAQPRAVWIVKLADRITNLMPPPRGWTPEKCRAYRDQGILIADSLGEASDYLHTRIRARIEAYSAYL